MLEKGYYAIYRGKEYHVTCMMDTNEIKIYTYDKSLADESFIEHSWFENSKVYEKYVKPSDLDDVYDVTPVAYIDGNRKLGIMKEKDDMLLVFTGRGHMDLIEKFQLKEVDRGVFEGWISKDEVQLVEEREDMTRQFGVIKRTRNGE